VGLAAIIIVAVLLVLGLGLLVFFLMRRSQTVVPDVAEQQGAPNDRVVSVDAQGRPVLESQEVDDSPPHDDAAFENVLKEELDDLGR
jgi:hypothetical protein